MTKILTFLQFVALCSMILQSLFQSTKVILGEFCTEGENSQGIEILMSTMQICHNSKVKT